MQALITGGAGFIGSNLARGLHDRDIRVRVIDDLSSGRRENLHGINIEFIKGDILDLELVAQAMEGVSWVFHQAALVSVEGSFEDPLRCYEANMQGSLAVLWAAQRAGVERVILASSAAVYGESTEPLSEDAPKKPLSPYAASKLAMESAAALFAGAYGLETVSLRYFNVYGPRQRLDSPYAAVIPAFIRAMQEGRAPTIYGDGHQRRDFVYVDDVVRANLLAAERSGLAGRAFNIGGGGSISIEDLARILQESYPGAPKPDYAAAREGDIHFSQASLQRAHEALGYRPATAIEDGLRITVEWFGPERQDPPQ